MIQERYTRYPRATLWLVREGQVTVGGSQADAQPAFVARVASFYLSKAPITNRQYEAFDPGHEREQAFAGDDDPASGIAFHDACRYCAWYAAVSRKPMRLPTEVEWEYACRGGFGLLGMLGGVWEWTSSLYLPYPVVEGDGRDDVGVTGRRVLRGGSFRVPRSDLGSGVRLGAEPDIRRDDVGFRIARSFECSP